MPSRESPQILIFQTALTILMGAAGGVLFFFLGLPAAWLSGSMVVVGLATLSGVSVAAPNGLRNVVFIFLGISMGAGVTPATLHHIATWPLSIAVLAVVVITIVLLGTLFLTRVARWDRATAFFSSVPGALSYVMALAMTTDADVRRVAISQSLRLFVLVAILPSIITATQYIPPSQVSSAHAGTWQDVGLLVTAAATVGFLFHRLNVPAGFLTGGLLASAILHATEIVTTQLPNFILIPGFVVLGSMIGTRFAGTTWGDLAKVAATSFAGFTLAMTISLAGAAFVTLAFNLHIGQTLLAFAPGGLEVMMVLAFALDLDPAYVGAHQMARFFAMALFLPLIMRFVGIKRKAQ